MLHCKAELGADGEGVGAEAALSEELGVRVLVDLEVSNSLLRGHGLDLVDLPALVVDEGAAGAQGDHARILTRLIAAGASLNAANTEGERQLTRALTNGKQITLTLG